MSIIAVDRQALRVIHCNMNSSTPTYAIGFSKSGPYVQIQGQKGGQYQKFEELCLAAMNRSF